MTRDERKRLTQAHNELVAAMKVMSSGRADMGRRQAIEAVKMIGNMLKADDAKLAK